MLNELMGLMNTVGKKEQKESIEEEINSNESSSSLSNKKIGTIVIAEENPKYTTLLKKESIALSYYIIHVENGIPGLKTMQKIIPLIAIIDFDTYTISEKYESIKMIKRQYKNIPIIMLCNIIPDDLQTKFNQHNFVSYIHKPINGRQLQEIIN